MTQLCVRMLNWNPYLSWKWPDTENLLGFHPDEKAFTVYRFKPKVIATWVRIESNCISLLTPRSMSVTCHMEPIRFTWSDNYTQLSIGILFIPGELHGTVVLSRIFRSQPSDSDRENSSWGVVMEIESSWYGTDIAFLSLDFDVFVAETAVSTTKVFPVILIAWFVWAPDHSCPTNVAFHRVCYRQCNLGTCKEH